MHKGLHVKIPLFLSDGDETWILYTDFRKIFKYQISRKFVQLEPRYSMRTDGQTDTDMTKVTAAFRNFGKTVKSPNRIAGTQPIFEPGTYWIRNTSANRSAETLGPRFIDGPPCTFIYYANTTVAQNECLLLRYEIMLSHMTTRLSE
jgi:hypothetical protein